MTFHIEGHSNNHDKTKFSSFIKTYTTPCAVTANLGSSSTDLVKNVVELMN